MTKQTLRKKAGQLGHTLSRFETRRFHSSWGRAGAIMYHVAWCQKCQTAFFTSGDNFALDQKRTCQSVQELNHE